MDTRSFILTTGLAATLAVSSASAGQHEGHQTTGAATPGTAQVAQCRSAQPAVTAAIEGALQRLDQARQTNSPSVMRSAADDLQSALLAMRAQLAPCAEMQLAAADPQTRAATPNVQQAPVAAPGTPVMQPGTTTAAPGAVAPAAPAPGGVDPHAGHVLPAAPTAAAEQAAAPRQPQQRAQAKPTNTPSITFRTIPSPPRGAAENEFEVTVKDPQGKPIDGAEVTLLFYMAAMPAMKMPEMRSEAKLRGTGSGTYTGKGQVAMAGPWTVTVSVKQNAKEIGQQRVQVTAR